MKRILITGKNSYIGNSVQAWLEKEPENYYVETIDMRTDEWKKADFSKFDVVFHVAGIAHIKETRRNKSLYYKINRDLAFETAEKSKREGVHQFIFLSSMSVYGISKGMISIDDKPTPNSSYGISKYEGEQLIVQLNDNTFKVVIMRPPMVYGKDCKGNYPRLSNLAKKSRTFPSIKNIRSMIYINHLSNVIKEIIDSNLKGLFLPQNSEYICTSEMVKTIAELNGKQIKLTKLFNPFIKFINLPVTNKIFGNLYYERQKQLVDDISFKESIRETEGIKL